MRLLFDINHPVDINFFKNAIACLKNENHDIYIIYRNRGALELILKYELGEYSITSIGEHRKGFLNKIIYQFKRDFQIVPFIKKKKIDIVICFGPTSALAAKICKIPYLAFDDDFEYKIPFYHANYLCKRHIYPDFIQYSNSRTYKYHGFKELAYINPKYFNPSKKILKEYKLKGEDYVFIREIANVSLNYKENKSILKGLIKKIEDRGLKVILSLEDKSLKKYYEKDCIILKEPVSDIYSLLYFALFAVSSGDTVARETSLMGVPTIYTGGRVMAVNSELIKKGLLYDISNLKEVENFVDKLDIKQKNVNRQKANTLINDKWDDTTKVILSHVNDFIE